MVGDANYPPQSLPIVLDAIVGRPFRIFKHIFGEDAMLQNVAHRLVNQKRKPF